MKIYEKHAKIILFLHINFYKLVTKEFLTKENFNEEEYESKIKLNKNVKKYITYQKWNTKESGKNVFPAYKVYSSQCHGNFSLVYKSYSGIVGNKFFKKIKKKVEAGESNGALKRKRGSKEFWNGRHGLFDFYLDTGNRFKSLYNGGTTHFNLFNDLKKNATFEDCKKVWRGEDFYTGEENKDKLEALFTLFLLMLEQEINYGELDFQQYSNFSISKGFRPRDMIMGFINMMYNGEDVFDTYPFWTGNVKKGIKYSAHFGLDKEKEGYANLKEQYKKYFEEYRNSYPDVKSLFDNENIKNCFNSIANDTGQNPKLEKLDEGLVK